jgi:hemolysin III
LRSPGAMDGELFPLVKWTQSRGEELANSISHGIGLVGALIGAPVLLFAALNTGNDGFFVGAIVFVATTLLLYLASTLYHAWPQTNGKCVLQVIDHSAIFLLIAGTYSPFTLGPLAGVWGTTMFGVIWALAIFGVLLKRWRGADRHRKLTLALYLGMGWLALVVVRPLASVVPIATLVWLFAGGIAYTAGVIFFLNEQRRYSHFVWHLFVLAGTGCHFLAVLGCAG